MQYAKSIPSVDTTYMSSVRFNPALFLVKHVRYCTHVHKFKNNGMERIKISKRMSFFIRLNLRS